VVFDGSLRGSKDMAKKILVTDAEDASKQVTTDEKTNGFLGGEFWQKLALRGEELQDANSKVGGSQPDSGKHVTTSKGKDDDDDDDDKKRSGKGKDDDDDDDKKRAGKGKDDDDDDDKKRSG